MPVGYAEEIKMYPMTLSEFAIAAGVKDETLEYLRECFVQQKEVDKIIHEKMMNLFYHYLVIGGMPAVVQKFIDGNNLQQISDEQRNIINFYKADFIKYEQADKKLRIIEIYENIPSQLNKQNLKFVFMLLNKELKFDRYENSFLWLKDAAVSIPVYITQKAKAPLVISKEKNTFKLFMNDVGLLVNYYPVNVKTDMIQKGQSSIINNGALFENFTAQTLTANGITPYYFKNKKIGEVDFLIEINGNVLPVEIKSGKDFTIHSALNNLLAVKEYKLEKAIVFSCSNTEKDNSIVYMPIYLLDFLTNSPVQDVTLNMEEFKF